MALISRRVKGRTFREYEISTPVLIKTVDMNKNGGNQDCMSVPFDSKIQNHSIPSTKIFWVDVMHAQPSTPLLEVENRMQKSAGRLYWVDR